MGDVVKLVTKTTHVYEACVQARKSAEAKQVTLKAAVRLSNERATITELDRRQNELLGKNKIDQIEAERLSY